jgi:AmmeMemoRadiSam system protein A
VDAVDRQDLRGTELIRLARGSIEYGLVHGEPAPIQCERLAEELMEPAATFTTLRLQGKLRGCCGALEAVHPLGIDVSLSAFRAAFRDTRFHPVGEHEIHVIRLEVSVLSPLEPLVVAGETDLLNQLVPGRDGLVLEEDGRRATFLPTVWETLPDPRQFLAALKAKSGLPGDYWSERLRFQRYRTTTYPEAD